jgi:adenylate cyclase
MLGDDDATRAEAAEVERAIALDPNSAQGYVALAEVMNSMAKPAQALSAAAMAIRLDPQNRDLYIGERGFAYTLLGCWKEAIPATKRFLARDANNSWSHAYLAVDYIELGRDDAAPTEAEEVLRLNLSSL